MPGVGAGGAAPADAAESAFRHALARWASGVAVVAVRQDGSIQAMTVTAFMVVSLRPAVIAVAVGEHAPLATQLEPDTPFAISLLGGDQRRWANVFADVFAADRTGFPASGDPVLTGSIAGLGCSVSSVEAVGDHRLILGAVTAVHIGNGEPPLLYYNRRYHHLGEER